MKIPVYTKEGKEGKAIDVAESLLGLPWNADLVNQVTQGMLSNKRAGTAHTKDRSEVRGGGKKPWKQKGTGRARHGSSRSPIWVGGGIAHGPRNEKNFKKKINRKMAAKAFLVALSQKFRDGELLFVDNFALNGKAKETRDVIAGLSKVSKFEKLAGAKKTIALVALAKTEKETVRALANFPQFLVRKAKDISALDVLTYRYVIVENPASFVEGLGKKVVAKKK